MDARSLGLPICDCKERPVCQLTYAPKIDLKTAWFFRDSNYFLRLSENQFIQNAQIAMNSKILKKICGIIATISCVSLAFFFLPEFWFWVSFDFSAAAIVATGCGGEWWLHHHPAGRRKKEKDLHHALESRFIGMVVIGLIMELVMLGHSTYGGLKLENKVSAANERAANAAERAGEANKQAGLANERAERLRNENLKLARDLEKLRSQRWLIFNGSAFEGALKNSPKMDVQIWYPPHDPEAEKLVNLELKDALQHAGWTTAEIRQFEPAFDSGSESSTPFSVRMGSSSESVEILVNSHDFWKTVGDVWNRDDIQTAPKSLAKAFDASGILWREIIPKPSFPIVLNGVVIDVPTNTIRIIVFPKQF